MTPTRAGLPRLPWSRFRTLRASWDKAVLDVTRYIDDALADDNRKHGKTAKVLTMDEARRVASNIAKLPTLLPRK